MPKGCAHGYQTLVDDDGDVLPGSRVLSPARSGGSDWNDPLFAIEWPIREPPIVSPKDAPGQIRSTRLKQSGTKIFSRIDDDHRRHALEQRNTGKPSSRADGRRVHGPGYRISDAAGDARDAAWSRLPIARWHEADRAYREAAPTRTRTVARAAELDEAIAAGAYAITENASSVCDAEHVDVIIEATGEVEFGARVVMHAIARRKHVVLMNAELDATVGPLLKIMLIARAS